MSLIGLLELSKDLFAIDCRCDDVVVEVRLKLFVFCAELSKFRVLGFERVNLRLEDTVLHQQLVNSRDMSLLKFATLAFLSFSHQVKDNINALSVVTDLLVLFIRAVYSDSILLQCEGILTKDLVTN